MSGPSATASPGRGKMGAAVSGAVRGGQDD